MPPAKKSFSLFSFLKAGFLEIGFILLCLFILFGVLAYFNIFKLTTIRGLFPSFQKQQQVTLTTDANINPLAYSKLKTVFSYVQPILDPSFFPSSMVTTNNSHITKVTLKTGVELWTTVWIASNTQVATNTSFIADQNSLQTLFIVITPTQGTISPNSITSETAQNLITKYFPHFSSKVSDWRCHTNPNYCEIFSRQQVGKVGYGMGENIKTKSAYIFSCIFAKDGKYYTASWSNSCYPAF